jgi:hypothetical protein
VVTIVPVVALGLAAALTPPASQAAAPGVGSGDAPESAMAPPGAQAAAGEEPAATEAVAAAPADDITAEPNDSDSDREILEPDPLLPGEESGGNPSEAPTESPTENSEGPAAEVGEAPANGEEEGKPKEQPPRVDGVFLGMTVFGASVNARAMHLDTEPFGGGGGAMRLGQAVFPWMTIAVEGGGGFAINAHQLLQQGGAMFEFGFLPVPRKPFSIRAGVGFGAGFILDDRTDTKGGFGGPKFSGALRYEFFPGAAKRRAHRAGGFSIGPEAGWRGFTPSSKGKPMAHTFYAGIWIGYYWGR